MNRREAIQLIGGAIATPAMFGALSGHARAPASNWKPSVLNRDGLAVVARVVDIMLPRTDTPGALDVGVPAFIDTMLKEVYSPAVREHYLEGLHDFDAAARKEHRQPFVKLETSRQTALIRRFHAAAIAQEGAVSAQEQDDLGKEVHGAAILAQRTQPPAKRKRPFILTTKELALLGFFTSKPGATQVLQYIAIPGAYHGCLPVTKAGNGKRWAT